ncbi:hypothetical protein F5B17DRAFT_429079 [Nemania serpens]|nr:hypothetical protein F5B17DRAFT_429079 [Nemania serpens]
MSAAPDDRDQGDVTPLLRDEPGGADHALNSGEGVPAVNSVESDEEDPRSGNIPNHEQDHDRYNYSDTEATESDAKNVTPGLPPLRRHQNTPSSLEHVGMTNGVPGPSMSSPRSSPSRASEEPSQHGSINGVNGVGEGNELDGASSAEASSSTSGSPSPGSPRSRGSPSPDPPNPPNQEDGNDQDDDPESRNGGQAENAAEGRDASQATDAENRGLPETSASPDHSPGPNADSDARGHTERQISRGTSSLGTASNVDSDAVTAPSIVGPGSFQRQPNEPGPDTGLSTQSSRLGPSFEASTVSSGLALPPIQPSPPLSPLSPMNPTAPSFVPRSVEPGITREFTLPRWQPDAEFVTDVPLIALLFLTRTLSDRLEIQDRS